jgi:hypothetical protein
VEAEEAAPGRTNRQHKDGCTSVGVLRTNSKSFHAADQLPSLLPQTFSTEMLWDERQQQLAQEQQWLA